MVTKYLIPAVAVLGIAIGSFGTLKITKAVKPNITLTPTACNCDCPSIPPSNGIDFDKIKNARGLTIQNHQYYVMQGDTLSQAALVDAFRKVVQEQKLARCK